MSVAVAVGLMFFQQFVGINSVIYYLPILFKDAFGFASAQSIWASIGIGG